MAEPKKVWDILKAEIKETPESHRATARTWMREQTARMNRAHEKMLARRELQPWHRRHRDLMWVSGIILGVMAVALFIALVAT